MDLIYLDNNSTTPVLPEVIAAMEPFWGADALKQGRYGNPSSRHSAGRRARRALEDARECVAHYLGALPEEVIFTSGGTEANNMAIFGLLGGAGPQTAPEATGRLITSAIEHPSVAECFGALEQRGWQVTRLGVNTEGLVSPAELEEHLESLPDQSQQTVRLVSVMLANNETGALQPVEQLAELARRRAVPFHTDAVQAVGKVPVNFHQLGVTSLSIGAHKFHGPKGIGAILVRRGTKFAPQLCGGPQQERLRPGTEPVALVVGMAKALERACSDLTKRAATLRALRDRLHQGLKEAIPDVALNGPIEERLPNTLNVSFPGVDAQALLIRLDLEGVACSVGSACASGSTQPSPVLRAMRLPEPVLRSAVRFSVGAQNTAEELDEAARRIASVVRRLREHDPKPSRALTAVSSVRG